MLNLFINQLSFVENVLKRESFMNIFVIMSSAGEILSLGRTLKQYRDNISLTLRQVEEVTGISNAYLSQLENDKIKKPSANVLYKLASIYRVELETLLAAAGIIQEASIESNPPLMRTIAFYAGNLSDDDKSKVVEFMQFLQSKKK